MRVQRYPAPGFADHPRCPADDPDRSCRRSGGAAVLGLRSPGTTSKTSGVQNIKGVWAYARRLMMVISIEQTRYGRCQAMRCSLPQACAARRGVDRYFVVVDEDIDITDINHVLWALFTRVDPAESIHVLRTPTTAIDPRLSPAKREAGDMSMGIC